MKLVNNLQSLKIDNKYNVIKIINKLKKDLLQSTNPHKIINIKTKTVLINLILRKKYTEAIQKSTDNQVIV